jgi:hypothetical protein
MMMDWMIDTNQLSNIWHDDKYLDGMLILYLHDCIIQMEQEMTLPLNEDMLGILLIQLLMTYILQLLVI